MLLIACGTKSVTKSVADMSVIRMRYRLLDV